MGIPTTRHVVASIVAALLAAGPATAKVLLGRNEALAKAFPEAATDSRTVVLTDAQAEAVERRTGAPPPSKLFTYHLARRDDVVIGYAVLDTHVVRTLPEALLIVLSPTGSVERVMLLAFHEPPEYEPRERFLSQFPGRSAATPGWRVGHDLHGISGATLTAHAVTAAVRRTAVLFDVVIRPDAAG